MQRLHIATGTRCDISEMVQPVTEVPLQLIENVAIRRDDAIVRSYHDGSAGRATFATSCNGTARLLRDVCYEW